MGVVGWRMANELWSKEESACHSKEKADFFLRNGDEMISIKHSTPGAHFIVLFRHFKVYRT